jgi:hypothetical protein
MARVAVPPMSLGLCGCVLLQAPWSHGSRSCAANEPGVVWVCVASGSLTAWLA